MATSTVLLPASASTQSTSVYKGDDAVAAARNVATLKDDGHPGPITLETFKDHQSNVLPHKKLMVVFPAIALAQMISYLDQTSVSTAVPAIGSSLNLGPSISWVAGSFLIASTSVQLLNGRLSDIFGRKPLLLTCMGMLAVGNLVAGFSKTPSMLFAFRALSGLGGGTINALVMIIASDVTTLQERGKYNGFIGASVALGNGIGPLIGGAVTERASWQWCLWFIVPFILFVMTLLGLVIPKSTVSGNMLTKLKMIDWAGLLISIAAVVLILVPISVGGAAFAWNSSLVIIMLAIGSTMILVFLLVEWRFARLPIMPLRLFTNNISANLILVYGTLQGVVYWSNLFYVPLYLQNVRGYGPIISGAVIVPMLVSHGVGSIISGQIISRTGHYNLVIVPGNLVWTIGASLQTLYTRKTPIFAVCLIGFLQGIGIGCAFQREVALYYAWDLNPPFKHRYPFVRPTHMFTASLVSLLAHSRKADRAVINSLRNFLRTMGGTVGLTVSGAILNNVLKARLTDHLPQSSIIQLTSSAYALPSLDLTPTQHELVLDAYMKGMHSVFVMYAPVIGMCFIAALLVKDRGVAEKDANAEERRAVGVIAEDVEMVERGEHGGAAVQKA